MKISSIVLLITLLVFLFLFSCKKDSIAKELHLAESLMQTSPDSTLLLLESIPSPEKMNKKDYALYCLLLTEARDKNYYQFTSDSVIWVAAEYYEATEDKRRLSKAYYYVGRVHQEPARFYQHTGECDSALFYLNQSVQSKNLYTKAASYYRLYQIVKEKQDYKQALNYNSYRESITQLTEREEGLRIQNLYNFQKLTAEKEELIKQHDRKQHLVSMLLFVSLFTILLLIVLFLYQKQRRRSDLLIQEKLLRLKEEQYRKSQEQIKENTLQIESLKNRLKEYLTPLDQTDVALIEKQVNILEYENQNVVSFVENKKNQYERIISSPAYTCLKNAGFGELPEKEIWNEFKQIIDQTYGNIEIKLRVYYPKISEQELKICYLINAKFSVTEIAALLGRTKSAITKCRKRLYEKIHNTTGSGEDLDRFIEHL